MNQDELQYIPPLRYHWLTRFYDPLVRLTTREAAFKAALIRQVAARPHDQMLDLGCGTATLTIGLAQTYPTSALTGFDADIGALAIAQAKAQQARVMVSFEHGFSFRMPFADESFDRTVSSLFFHHLTRAEKSATLTEIRRVLKPGGELHIADWGRPANALMRTVFLVVQILDGFETTRDSVEDRLPPLMEAAGFRGVARTRSFNTPLGTIDLYRATK